jgi:hypothetical protein
MRRGRTVDLRAGALAVLLTAVASVAAQGPLENRPRRDEVETAQLGGRYPAQYSGVGALRCERTGDVMVGVQVRRSAIVDALQVLCAPVACDSGRCTWTGRYAGPGAGDRSGGATQAPIVCEADEAISGYRGRTRVVSADRAPGRPVRVDYIDDIVFQCARIVGPAAGVGGMAFPIDRSAASRTWRTAGGATTDAPAGAGTTAAECADSSATALSVAVGTYLPDGRGVAQAMSMFCGRPGREAPPQACPAGQAHMGAMRVAVNRSRGRADDAACPECCKPCVDLRASTDPSTLETDRVFADVPRSGYNGDGYLRPVVDGKAANPRGGVACVHDEDLERAGWQRAQQGRVDATALRPRDIVRVGESSPDARRARCTNRQSGVVISEGDAAGVRIRLKDGPLGCVVDLSLREFVGVYDAAGTGTVSAWRRGP